MKKRIGLAIFCAMLLAVTACGLAGCGFFLDSFGGVAVERISIETTEITLAPVGDANKWQLQPEVYPANATVKTVSYRIMNAADKQYLNVDAAGWLRATGVAKEDGEPIIVRILSNQDSSIYVDIHVTIGSETERVQRISFDPASITLKRVDENAFETYKAVPSFYPWHSVLGRDVTWESRNPDIATVDSNGVITPVRTGMVYITAISAQSDGSDPIKGQLEVHVTHADLSYEIRAVNDNSSVMRQIVGREEEIRLTLLQMDPLSDPNPQIRWYVGSERQTTMEGKRDFRYTPNLPYGSYEIRAEITNNMQSLTLIYPVNLMMYRPLEAFDVNILNESDTLHVNDILTLQAGYATESYPPEAFQWYMREVGDTGLGNFITTTPTNELNYHLQRAGHYQFTAIAIVKGLPDVSAISPTVTVDVAEAGSEIYDVYFDATEVDGAAVPVVKWRYPGYEATYRLEVIKEDGSVVTLGDERVARGATPMAVLREVTLNDTFSVRIATERFGWSEMATYAGGDYAEADINYYRSLEWVGDNGYALNMNGFIVNMEEMGDLLNYIALFRPEALRVQNDTYQITYKTTFGYAQLDSNRYPTSDNAVGDESVREAYKIIYAAFNAYAESGSFTPGITVLGDGGVRLQLTFSVAPAEGVYESNQTNIYEWYTAAHYTARSNADDVLPIERETQSTLRVTTTNQLMFAVENGLYPQLAAGSAAERIWQSAKEVSLRIIDATMTDIDKVHAIYDYLTTEVVYDYRLLDLVSGASTSNADYSNYASFFMEGVFDNGVAVCDGIAKAFVLLARMQGIAVVKETGDVLQGGSRVAHAWNRVMIDGQWYVCDATWGSLHPSGTDYEVQTHSYLLVADSAIGSDHIGYGEYPAAPEGLDVYYVAERNGAPDRVEDVKRITKQAIFDVMADDLNLEVVYVELTISEALADVLRVSYPNLSAPSALSTLWRAYAEEYEFTGSMFYMTVADRQIVYLYARRN